MPAQPAAVVVFAGDHGVVADGASAWPSEITGAMVRTMAAGGAAINAFATQAGATLTLVDVGVASDLGDLHAQGRSTCSTAGCGPGRRASPPARR